jgi:phosphatidylserine decarboxylase
MLIRKEGMPFIAGAAILAALLSKTPLRWLGMLPLAFVTWFFRDPEREAPEGADLVIAPADGKVVRVERTTEPQVGECTRISIFMNVFSVHVNRAPLAGTVSGRRYQQGRFHAANFLEKTEENERMCMYLETAVGTVRVDQVAGMIARRIVHFAPEGTSLAKGERFGLIRFGSMVEVFLPAGVSPAVKLGDHTTAGATILGRIA